MSEYYGPADTEQKRIQHARLQESEIERLREILLSVARDLRVIESASVDGQNELHGISHTTPAKRTLRYIQKKAGDIATTAEIGGAE